MTRLIFTVPVLILLSGCVIPRTVDRLQASSPPPEFGRPGWVRAMAGTGAWVGGVVGGVASIALLPVTYPLSWLAQDSLGEAGSEELLFFPAVGLAATGHFLLGGPPDVLDHVFRRAWLSEPPPANTYELIPIETPLPAPPEAVFDPNKPDVRSPIEG